LVIESFDLVQGPFKSVGIIEDWIVIYADPFDLVLQSTVLLSALENLLNLLFWVLVIDYWQQRFLVLIRQRVSWVLAEEF
jgi:hypothetical protein